MARQVLTLKMIRRELKDGARPVIDRVVSSVETLYEFVFEGAWNMIRTSREHFLPK